MQGDLYLLVVEDDPHVSEYIKTVLESFVDGKIKRVSSGEDALIQVTEKIPDLILMDIILEGKLDGIETARHIHERHDVPIIYLTGFDDEHFLERAKITDPFAYMIKPVQPRELQAVVTIALQQHEKKVLLQHDSYVTKSLKKIFHPLIITNSLGDVTSINEAASKLFGISEEGTMGRSCSAFLRILIHEREMVLAEEIARAVSNDGLFKEEEAVKLWLPNGGTIPISLTISLVNNDLGELEGLTIMIVDLTQQTVEKNLLHRKQLEAAELLIRERRLKEILDIGKDINQALLHATPIEERLQIVVDRIVQFSNFKIAHIALDSSGTLMGVASSRNSRLYLEHPESIPRRDPFLERLYSCLEEGAIDLWEKAAGSFPSLFNRRAESIPVHSVLMLPLLSSQSAVALGVMSIASSHQQTFDIDTVNYFEEFANDIALAITLQRNRDEIEALKLHRERNFEQTILSFVQMIEERDIYTRGHSERVAGYSVAIAKEMGYDEVACDKLYRGAILHDIGKIQTPDKILLNPGELDVDEYKIVQEHVNSGFRMLGHIDMYDDIANLVAQHHEHYDGNGYPYGLNKDKIIQLAAILSVSDAFDAMTTNRIYRKSLSMEGALMELESEAGQQFDPDVVKSALVALPSFSIPETDQLANSSLERERMAYFYRDPLTHLYSEEYFQFYVQHLTEQTSRQYLCIYRLSGLATYNEEQGWCLGNEKIKKVAMTLTENIQTEDSFIFRLHGNKFVIFSKRPVDVVKVETALLPLYEETQLRAKLECHEIQALQKDAESKDLDQIIHQLIC